MIIAAVVVDHSKQKVLEEYINQEGDYKAGEGLHAASFDENPKS